MGVVYNMNTKWIKSILDIYWELRPCYKTQELYKSHNLQAFDYWIYEIQYLTQSTWAKTTEFCTLDGIQYLLDKYPEEKIKLDHEDRIALGTQFFIDLGMNPATFTFKIP